MKSRFKTPLRVLQNLLKALSYPFMMLDYQMDFIPHQQQQFFWNRSKTF